jgi:hypothetical protein
MDEGAAGRIFMCGERFISLRSGNRGLQVNNRKLMIHIMDESQHSPLDGFWEIHMI